MYSQEDNDTDFIQHLTLTEEHVFKDIYDRYWQKMYRLAQTKVGHSENAKEIVQEIFLDLWQRRKEVEIREIERYLFTSVKYKVLDYIKQEILRKRYIDFVVTNDSDIDCDSEQKIAFKELSTEIATGINQLPEKTKIIFEMSRMQFKSAEEISNVLNISTRTVEYHITQGLRLLRIYLKDYIVISFFYFCNLY
ncbi:RNA polymerase sigma-70 factor (ECF subfamily) [Dyadobacter jejuensis]|uniref:RNA polymerase sigma-70 factor (ECF subfamily) n=1 Tax=Dyadobacter jejuensis TaxID=1082580 RepID=A0A316AB03_9BACT|nr:RNA polymerase sigma-70 factor [Dyadobacter jejuensis]PWJ55016.1 RNA polymerase sigma-70 factor (ECF subfamily) [Dyadobacter jejuensis]